MTLPEGTLAETFRRLIQNHGPISLSHFMGESNTHYYSRGNPLGREGDFVTAPEISQMFGELIGLWLADIWIRAGREEPALYVELGPGRGTLAKDALRAAKRYGFEPEVHFVEASGALRDMQLAELPGANWHNDLSTVPFDGPMLLVANEFLDALPIRQLVRTADGWRERMVGLDGDGFQFIAGQNPMESAIPEDRRDAPEGTIIETCPGAAAIIYEIVGRLEQQGGAALLIDYGRTEPQQGSTLQAIRRHTKIDPLDAPGDADLTALVDFSTLANVAQSRDARWLGTVTQGHFLRALGIDARADALVEAAPHYRDEIYAARDRLAGDDQMGELFKVMALTSQNWPDAPGFTSE